MLAVARHCHSSTAICVFKTLQEIHYDRIGGRDASKLVNADLPDVIEIWNNVFIQYNREADGSLRPLPAQHVDTGMGFERLTSILQGVDSNYDTDIFLPLFAAIQEVTGARTYEGKVGKDDPEFIDMAYRVVADHIRTLSFAIADGAVPSNDGRGYVLRRVLRRAVRYGRQNLGAELGFFAKLVPVIVGVMEDSFPELRAKQERITAIIVDEEESFSRTLDRGLHKFKQLAEKSDKVFSGEDAHFLYTSMGFPVDLTELMAEEKGLTLDREGFEKKMDEEAMMSRGDRDGKHGGANGKDMHMVAEQISYLVTRDVPGTNDDAKYEWDKELEGCEIKALFLGRNETEDKIGFVETVATDSGCVGVILDRTSFYAEAGGQVNDTGVIKTASGVMQVKDVQMYGQFVLHIGDIESGSFKVGESATCAVDYVRRLPIASNHTMTHVLNLALLDVLVKIPEKETGKSVLQTIDQKGSINDESKLRFDFSWNAPLSAEQLSDVEELCNEEIKKAVPVQSFVAPLGQAQQISSLRAVFGEKYPDPVRVVAVSDRLIPEMLANPQDTQWGEYSVEFCGGTHLSNTRDAEAFVLLSEEGIAKGIRRIVAVTKDDAKEALHAAAVFQASLILAETLTGDDLESHIKKLSDEVNELKISAHKKIHFREALAEYNKQIFETKKAQLAGLVNAFVEKAIAEATAATGEKIVMRFDFGTDGKIAKSISTSFCKKVKDKALLLVSADAEADKCLIMGCCAKGVGLDCKAWVLAATDGLDAKGGGGKELATFQLVGASHADTIVANASK